MWDRQLSKKATPQYNYKRGPFIREVPSLWSQVNGTGHLNRHDPTILLDLGFRRDGIEGDGVKPPCLKGLREFNCRKVSRSGSPGSLLTAWWLLAGTTPSLLISSIRAGSSPLCHCIGVVTRVKLSVEWPLLLAIKKFHSSPVKWSTWWRRNHWETSSLLSLYRLGQTLPFSFPSDSTYAYSPDSVVFFRLGRLLLDLGIQ